MIESDNTEGKTMKVDANMNTWLDSYEQRVRAMEAEGMTRSDAQSVIDAEDSKPRYLMNPATGSVDTVEGWAAEGWTTENANLVAVVQINYSWREVS